MESDAPATTVEQGRSKSRAAAWSVAVCAFLTALKLVVGFASGSVSILSEAAHSGNDLVAAVMAFFAVRTASKPADRDHPYGHGKYESLSGAVEALLIFVAAGAIIVMAKNRLEEGGEIGMHGIGTAVMAISAVLNFFVSANLFRTAKATDSIALEADAWHLRTDVYTSGGVTIGVLAMWALPGLWWIDPLAAFFVAFLILKAAYTLTRTSVQQILDRALPPDEQRMVVELLTEHYSEYLEFHRLRTRKAGSERHLDLHLVVPADMSVQASHDLCDHLEDDIQQILPGARTLIHVEPGPSLPPGFAEQTPSESAEQTPPGFAGQTLPESAEQTPPGEHAETGS